MARKGIGNLRRKSSAAIGILTLVCGLMMMWGSSRGIIQQGAVETDLYSQAVEIDPLIPDSSNNGKVILAAGKLSSTELLEDEFLKPGSYLVLSRRVDMFQWQETRSPLADSVQYSLGWHEGQVDFFTFRQPTGHENPLLRYQPFTRQVSSALFGSFDAGVILRSVRRLLPVTLTPELLKDPSLEIVDNRIIVRRVSGGGEGTNLGDMRVWYEALPQGEYTVLTRQIDERNLLGANPSTDMFIKQGVASVDELFSDQKAQARQASDGLLYFGGVVFAVGLFSLLAPIAHRIDLRPRFPLTGPLALVAVCIAVAAVVVVVFFILGRL
jgi:hypothetical protein